MRAYRRALLLRSFRVLWFLALILSATGCDRVTLVDDVDLTLDFNPLLGPSDALHTPYVAGATMTVWARSTKDHEDTTGWTLESSEPSVFHVVAGASHRDNALGAVCHAGGPGTATITVKDARGAVLATRAVEVKVPDRADLLSHGPLIIERPEAEALTDQARVLIGGTATFLVRWYTGTELLHGNGVLSATPDDGLTVQTPTSFLFEDRDWLQVMPGGAAAQLGVQLFADGHFVRSFTVIPVAQSELVDIRLRGQDESRAHDKEMLAVLAEGLDASGRTLLGIAYQWTVDGVLQQGVGDLYRYQYDAANPSMLSASFAGKSAEAPIHFGTGYVSSTNKVGCSLGGRRGGPGALGGSLAALGLLALVRSRRRRR